MPDLTSPLSTKEILALLQTVLQDAGIELPPEELTPETSLTMDLGIDSFHLVEIATRVEGVFDSRFTLVDWVVDQQDAPDPAFTLASLVVFIQEQLAAVRIAAVRSAAEPLAKPATQP